MNFEYGCIGETLKHSFSKEIHESLKKYTYELIEILKDKLEKFMTDKNFKAVNVTIPYKEAVIPYLYEIDAHAKEIGAVNTVVNRDGKLYGYNTDFYGMRELIRHASVEIFGKKVAILGTGGTSKTAYAVAKSLGAESIVKVSRKSGEDTVTYGELYEKHGDTEIIINTTPVGMYPNVFDTPLDLCGFDKLSGVIDAVYNPIRTPLICEAQKRGVRAESGLYMLVAQAVRASEIFLGITYPADTTEKIYSSLIRKKENLVLIGMPSCGKSTVGKMLAKALDREFIDTDNLIAENEGKEIPEIFASRGEDYFREAEEKAVKSCAHLSGKVIATGGGAVLRATNVSALSENGKIYFIDRPPQSLLVTSDRPLSKDRESINKLYNERYEIYKRYADKVISAECEADEVAKRILEDFCK